MRSMASFYGTNELPEQAGRTLAALGLEESALDLPVRQYSKGMTQKLGLVSSFVSGKELLVLDEPMSGLDPLARVRLKRQLEDLRREGDRTILLTAHSLADIDEICDHMILLHDSKIAFAGAPEDFRRDTGEPTLERAFLRRIGSA